MNRWFLGAFLILFQSCAAFAQEATFGPEFNFTNSKLIEAGRALGPSTINSEANTEAQKQFLAEVRKRCPDCKAKRLQDRYRIDVFQILTPEGWSFTITLDPWVVEVIVSPMTAKEVAQNAPRIQELIFDVAAAIGLHSPENTSGHLHVGVSSGFLRDPRSVRNFVVDWVNHSVAMADAYHAGMRNAAPMSMVKISESETILDRFGAFLTEWDREYHEYMKFLGPETMLSNFFVGVRDEVYVKSYMGQEPPSKFQNVNVDHFNSLPKDQQTLELRGVREFQSADEFAQFTKMIQGRLDYLRQVDFLIPLELEPSKKPHHQVFDEYMYQSKADLESARRMSKYGVRQYPIKISCEGLF